MTNALFLLACIQLVKKCTLQNFNINNSVMDLNSFTPPMNAKSYGTCFQCSWCATKSKRFGFWLWLWACTFIDLWCSLHVPKDPLPLESCWHYFESALGKYFLRCSCNNPQALLGSHFLIKNSHVCPQHTLLSPLLYIEDVMEQLLLSKPAVQAVLQVSFPFSSWIFSGIYGSITLRRISYFLYIFSLESAITDCSGYFNHC